MLKRTFAGTLACLVRGPAAPGTGFAAPLPFDRDNDAWGFPGLARSLAKAFAAPRPGRGVNKTITALSSLNDHTLADIGIHRSQIPALVRAVAERPGEDPRQVGS
jgi:uncharacterized protein YjiS (DUF1127 family)